MADEQSMRQSVVKLRKPVHQNVNCLGRRTMRILLIAHSDAPWTPYYGRYFLSRGDAVLVVSFGPYEIDGVDIKHVGVKAFDKYKNKWVYVTRVPRVRRIIRKFRPDLVLAPYLISNGLAAVLSWRGPTVVSARGGDVMIHPGRTGLKGFFRERVIQFVCRRADRVHTVSQGIWDRLVSLGVPESKLVRFPTGVNVERFRPAAGMPRSPVVRLICTRKHEPVYDIPTIIKALIQLKSAGRAFHCTFVGGGHLIGEHQSQAKAGGIGDHVTFIGHVTHEKLPSLLQQADLYLSSSLSDGTSSALLEAMATGLLPVVTRIPANTAWLTEGRNAIMFAPGQVNELVAALQQGMDDVCLRKLAFDENRRLVESEGNMDRNMERLWELCEQVIREKTLAPSP